MQLRRRLGTLVICCLLNLIPFILWGQSDASVWENYVQAATQAAEKPNYADAEWQLLNALQEAKKLGSRDFRLGLTHNYAGVVFEVQGKFAEAERAYIRAVADLEVVVVPKDFRLADSLLNPGNLYRTQRKSVLAAEPLLKGALAVRRGVAGSRIRVVAVLNLAELYYSQRRYAEAEPLYKRALEVEERTVGPEHPDFAEVLERLGNVYRHQGQYSEAEPFLKQALAIDEKVFGLEHPEVADNLGSLGSLYADQLKDRAAEPIYRRALAIDEKALGLEHPDVAIDLRNLGVTYRRLRRYEEAEQLLLRAVSIYERNDAEHLDLTRDLSELGNVYRRRGKFTESEEVLERALAIRERVLGRDHYALSYILQNMANLYIDQKRLPEAEAALRRILAIDENPVGPRNPNRALAQEDMAISLETLASVLRRMGRRAEAGQMRSRAATIRALQPQ